MAGILPKAPLAEVVFELRWDVAPGDLPLLADPTYSKVFDAVSAHAVKQGFERTVDIHKPYTGIPTTISRRMYRGEAPFPLVQMGPCIFAYNESVDYEWVAFRRQAIKGALTVAANLSKFREFKPEINHLELRYIDAFDPSVVTAATTLEFIERGTNMKVQLPPALTKQLRASTAGRVKFEWPLIVDEGTTFSLELGSGFREKMPIMRMESKVVWSGRRFPISAATPIRAALASWLETAHRVTSATFKAIVSEQLFSTFKAIE